MSVLNSFLSEHSNVKIVILETSIILQWNSEKKIDFRCNVVSLLEYNERKSIFGESRSKHFEMFSNTELMTTYCYWINMVNAYCQNYIKGKVKKVLYFCLFFQHILKYVCRCLSFQALCFHFRRITEIYIHLKKFLGICMISCKFSFW